MNEDPSPGGGRRAAAAVLLAGVVAGGVGLFAKGTTVSGPPPATDDPAGPPPAASDDPWGGLETTSSDDPLHPGLLSVTDAAELPDGWIVLDRRGGRLHRLARDGSPAGSFGRRGSGPGEYRDPVAVAVVVDTVVVVERVGATLHLFDPAGPFLGRRTPEIPDCFVPLVLDAGGTSAGPVLLLRCVDPATEVGDPAAAELVALIPRDGGPRILSRSPAESAVADPGRPLFSEPLLATGDGVVVVGRQSARCVRLFRVGDAGPGPPTERRCFPRRPRVRLDRETREYFREYVEELGHRSAGRLVPPRHHPIVHRLFAAGEDPVGALPAEDGSLTLFRLGPEPGTEGEGVAWGDGPFLVTAHHVLQSREELHGIRIRIRPLAPS